MAASGRRTTSDACASDGRLSSAVVPVVHAPPSIFQGLHHFEPHHHVIVLVIEDMAVPRILAGIVFEARDDGSHFARINAYGILESGFI
jgi:hypothetical protein